MVFFVLLIYTFILIKVNSFAIHKLLLNSNVFSLFVGDEIIIT